jgi:hypothetical protein
MTERIANGRGTSDVDTATSTLLVLIHHSDVVRLDIHRTPRRFRPELPNVPNNYIHGKVKPSALEVFFGQLSGDISFRI